MQVLYNIARAVSELHASGFVHRDIQPSNVIWLPRENRWSVISFRRTVRSGEYARVRYSLNYAAPEAIHADVNGKRSMLITPAIDAWSLGILAMELFTGTTVFDSSLNDHEVSLSMLTPTLEQPFRISWSVECLWSMFETCGMDQTRRAITCHLCRWKIRSWEHMGPNFLGRLVVLVLTWFQRLECSRSPSWPFSTATQHNGHQWTRSVACATGSCALSAHCPTAAP